MSSFVESATLLLTDAASAKIRKVNRELKDLFKTAQKLKNIKININVNTKGITKAHSEIKAFTQSANRLKNKRVSLTVTNQGITQAQQNLRRLRTLASRPITQRVNVVGGGGTGGLGGGGGGGGGQGRGGGNNFLGGRTIFGVAATFAAFTGLAAAANLAANALRAVGEAGAQRDRTNLALATNANKAQRDIIKAAQVPEGQGPIRFNNDERQRFILSLLGDVAAPTPEGKAQAAVKIGAEIERFVLPRLYAMKPDQSLEEVQQGLRKLVQAMNLGSSQITDTAGNLSTEGKRVMDAALLAMSVDPDLDAGLIKTTTANLKSAAYTMDTDQLARVFINAGARGQRVGNEAYRAIEAMSGRVKNIALNDLMEEAGLLVNVKRNKKGKMLSSDSVDPETLAENLQQFLLAYVAPQMDKALGPDATQTQQSNFIKDMFAGAPQTAVTAIHDYILGAKQFDAAIAQGKVSMGEDPNAEAVSHWTAQLANVGVALHDAAASQADAAMELIGAARALEVAAEVIRGEKDISDTTLGGAIDTVSGMDRANKLRELMGDWTDIFKTAPGEKQSNLIKFFDSILGPSKAAAAGGSGGDPQRIIDRAPAQRRNTLQTASDRLAVVTAQLAKENQIADALEAKGYGPTKRSDMLIERLEQEIFKLNSQIPSLETAVRADVAAKRLEPVTAEKSAAIKNTVDELIAKYAGITEDPGISAARSARNMRSRANLGEVQAFQKRMGIKEDGIVGKQTRDAMQRATAEFIKQGHSVDEIKQIQKDNGIKVDGIVGPQTSGVIDAIASANLLKEGGSVNILNPSAEYNRDRLGGTAPPLSPAAEFNRDRQGGARPENNAIVVSNKKGDPLHVAVFSGLGGASDAEINAANALAKTPDGVRPSGPLSDNTFGPQADQTVAKFNAAFGAGEVRIAGSATAAAGVVTAGIGTAGAAIHAAFSVGGASAAAQIRAALAAGVKVNISGGGAGAGADTGAQRVPGGV